MRVRSVVRGIKPTKSGEPTPPPGVCFVRWITGTGLTVTPAAEIASAAAAAAAAAGGGRGDAAVASGPSLPAPPVWMMKLPDMHQVIVAAAVGRSAANAEIGAVEQDAVGEGMVTAMRGEVEVRCQPKVRI